MRDDKEDNGLYTAFKSFLEDYFYDRYDLQIQSTPEKPDNYKTKTSAQKLLKKQKSAESEIFDDGKAISGGRYGCA